MTAQNVASLMYDIKEKITDKEFKDIMDALGVVHKNDEKQDVYLFKYYKMKMDIGRMHNGCMGNRLRYKYKEIKVVLHSDLDDGTIELLMNNVKSGIDYEFIIYNKKDKDKYPVLNRAHKTIDDLEPVEDYENYKDGEDDDKKPVLLEYNEIIPISIEKL
jgi:hypothetical protein